MGFVYFLGSNCLLSVTAPPSRFITLLAKQFDMKMIAEGVESKEQEAFFKQLGRFRSRLFLWQAGGL